MAVQRRLRQPLGHVLQPSQQDELAHPGAARGGVRGQEPLLERRERLAPGDQPLHDTPERAEKAGLIISKKWIDAGKP